MIGPARNDGILVLDFWPVVQGKGHEKTGVLKSRCLSSGDSVTLCLSKGGV